MSTPPLRRSDALAPAPVSAKGQIKSLMNCSVYRLIVPPYPAALGACSYRVGVDRFSGETGLKEIGNVQGRRNKPGRKNEGDHGHCTPDACAWVRRSGLLVHCSNVANVH